MAGNASSSARKPSSAKATAAEPPDCTIQHANAAAPTKHSRLWIHKSRTRRVLSEGNSGCTHARPTIWLRNTIIVASRGKQISSTYLPHARHRGLLPRTNLQMPHDLRRCEEEVTHAGADDEQAVESERAQTTDSTGRRCKGASIHCTGAG